MTTRAGAQLVAVVLLVASFGATGGSAAGLGGLTSGTLRAGTQATTTGAPVVVAWENFDASFGTPIAGTTTDGGGFTWQESSACDWETIVNSAWANNASACSLTIDTNSSTRAVEATMNRAFSSTWTLGVVANGNSSDSQYLTLEWTNAGSGTVRIRKFTGSFTQLAAVTNLYPGGTNSAPQSMHLRLDSSSTGVLRGYVDGVLTLTVTLTAGEQAIFKTTTHEQFGVFSESTGGLQDDFHVDATT